jgi:glucose repression regulatory protein TUP1
MIPGFMMQADFSPDDRLLAAPATFAEGNTSVYLIDPQSGETVQELPSEDGCSSIAKWSPDGKTLTVGYQSGAIKLWETGSWQVIKSLAGHQGGVWGLDWSPNGERLLSGDGDYNIAHVWDIERGEIVISFDMQGLLQGGLQNTEWHPDGEFIMIHGLDLPYIKRAWQSTEDLIAYAYDCCVWRSLTAEERSQFGLLEK